MATYVVGDIHGCFDDFQRLLEIIKFHRSQDRLWLVGDVVNRGTGNAAILRWLIEHEDRITLVLGNHDLHLLAAHANEGQLRKRDTFGDVFAATDGAALCDWLRKRPLAHAENGSLMVHAGVLPMWETETTLALAAEVGSRIARRRLAGFCRGHVRRQPPPNGATTCRERRACGSSSTP